VPGHSPVIFKAAHVQVAVGVLLHPRGRTQQ